jgi:hypothetical protein
VVPVSHITIAFLFIEAVEAIVDIFEAIDAIEEADTTLDISEEVGVASTGAEVSAGLSTAQAANSSSSLVDDTITYFIPEIHIESEQIPENLPGSPTTHPVVKSYPYSIFMPTNKKHHVKGNPQVKQPQAKSSKPESGVYRARVRGSVGRSATNAPPVPMPKFLLANIDPFNVAARGAKVPDDDSSFSFPIDDQNSTAAVSDGTYGAVAYGILADINNYAIINATTTGSTTVTWSANWNQQYATASITALQSSSSMYRIVGYGVKLTCPMPLTSCAGNVHVCYFPIDLANVGYSTTVPTTVGSMVKMPGYCQYPLGSLIKDDAYISGRVTGTDSYAYRDINAVIGGSTRQNTAVTVEYGWMGILIFVEGAPTSTPVLEIETVYHIEGIAKPGASLIENTLAAPWSPMIMANTKNITEALPGMRMVDPADPQKGTFFKDVTKLWNTGKQVVNGVIDGGSWLAAASEMLG